MRGRRIPLALAVAALAVPAAAFAGHFPSTHPGESPRLHTPNDPGFDECEPDDPDTPPADCTSYWEEQYGSFGFSPESANEVPALPHSVAATRYADCSQLDRQGRRANLSSGDPACAQISGVRADTAWKYTAGDPEVVVAILDTGIRWQDSELVNRVHLNVAELPTPLHDRNEPLAGSTPCADLGAGDDANGDGAVDVRDFACDSRVGPAAGDTESDHMLDASDLIATFSDGGDDDANGYADDIAGWDFFDDDNDPFDASSCCSAGGHGTGRAREAVAETDNANGETGMCPRCQFMPLRIWDTFVADTNLFSMGVVYAADNGASVVEGAIGGLLISSFARRAFAYADRKGLALTMVSSDVNTANHNFPTHYNEAIYVSGTLPDTAPYDTCAGPGSIPGADVIFDQLERIPVGGPLAEGCSRLLELLHDELGIDPTLQPITTSFFRNANLTQYGGKNDIVLIGSTGSVNTGQAAGAAALIQSYAREHLAGQDRFPRTLSGNEIRQLMTMTAEDVLPANTGVIGLPDKANPGWDPHFGYGRLNLAGAMRRIANDRIPPEAQLDAPDWYAPINIARVKAGVGVPIEGYAAAPHSAEGVGRWEVEYACGQDALDSEFRPIPGASGTGPVDGRLGVLPKWLLADLADECNGSVANDAGRPAGTLTDAWPADPYPDPDPERHAFQIRLTVHEAGDPTNIGRYRKTLFAYRNDGNLPGWPRPIGPGASAERHVTGSGGDVSPRLYDVNGDNRLDVLLPTSSGELHVLNSAGHPIRSFNDGKPVRTLPYAVAANHPPPAAVGGPPREPLRNPVIGDITGDREADIVATAGEHAYAWHLDGTPVAGFPARIRPALSHPCVAGVAKPCFDAAERSITEENHIKRGFMGSPALADLDCDGRLEVVAGALDQHVYAWDGNGELVDPFPVKLDAGDDGVTGAEIVTSPTVAELDGQRCGEGPDGGPEIVLATNEQQEADPSAPDGIADLLSALAESTTGSGFTYAIHGDGSPVDGWPVRTGVLAGDLLPLVGPGHDAAALDVDGDGEDEISLSAFTGEARLVDGDGTILRAYVNAGGNRLDQGPVVNLPHYSVVGDVLGNGDPAVFHGGMSLNGAANLVAANQNLPFNHVVEAWDVGTGLSLAGYPRATDDINFLTQAAVADVGGEGPGRQVLWQTGLYQLHAYGPGGAEPAGWPKFLGGWVFATPSAGDADGDGTLDVMTVTREGWAFLWETAAPSCETGAGASTNDEWWTFHHDERSSANYGADGRPPGTADALTARRQANGDVFVAWRAPGDDWLCGRAAQYRVLTSRSRIDDPADGRTLGSGPAGEPGDPAARTFTANEIGGADHVAVAYRDDAGNWGLVTRTRIE